jgi:hypothetical protein
MTSPYITRSRIHYLASTLSNRESEVLDTLRTVRVATSTQLEALHFSDVTRRQARQTMSSMVARRLIARLPRQVGGVRSGSAGYVYVLDVAGLRLGRSSGSSPARRPWSVGSPFLAHSLAVTGILVDLRKLETESDGRTKLHSFSAEPACWRPFTGPGGARIVLKPDAEVGLRTSNGRDGEWEDRWFIEVDRSTESRPTLARKLERYVQYWQTGREQHTAGVFPKVLWIVPDEARHAVLIDEFGRTPVAAWPLFAATTEAEAMTRMKAGAA